MPTILLKKSDTPGSVPGTANLTNLAGGVEVAVNTADKRVYSMTSASAVIELGTNPSSLTCSDVSATVLRAGSATITNLLATTLTVSGGTANGVLYLNGSKVATSGSALTFDGTSLTFGSTAQRIIADMSNATVANRFAFQNSVTNAQSIVSIIPNGTGTVSQLQLFNNSTPTNAPFAGLFVNSSEARIVSGVQGSGSYLPLTFYTNGSEQMRLDTSGVLLLGNTSNYGVGSAENNSLQAKGPIVLAANNTGSASNRNWVFQTNAAAAGSFSLAYSSTNTGWPNAAYAMVIDSSGNVGIGTASPTIGLTVQKENGSGYIAAFRNTAGSPYITLQTTSGITQIQGINSAFTATNDIAMQLSGGNVGIGTASPAANSLTLANKSLQVWRDTDYIQFLNAANSTYWGRISQSGNDIEFSNRQSGALKFLTADTTRATIDSSGNLGLGVTPNAWSGYKAIQIGQNGAVSSADSGTVTMVNSNCFFDGTNYKYISSAEASLYQQASGAHNWRIAASGTINTAISFTQAMTLDASGNLGVGATSPSATFRATVQGVGTSGNPMGGVLFRQGATDVFSISPISTDNTTDVEFWNYRNGYTRFGTNNTERGRFSAGGYFKASDAGTYLNSTSNYHELRSSNNSATVVITNTNGSYTDDLIYGNTSTAAGTGFKLIRLDSNSVEQFRVRGDGTIFAQNTTVQSLSDLRLKENISDANDGLSVITALRPVRYDWKTGYGNNRKNQLGFIAQEVETVFPDAVSVWEIDEPTGEVAEDGEPITEKVDYKTVGPGALIPVLVKAMQEQQAMIETLKAKVAALEAK